MNAVGAEQTSPYSEQLRAPQPCDHLIQLYTDEAFLGRVVGYQAGARMPPPQAALLGLGNVTPPAR
jgi:hypothetical protein